MTGDSKVQDLIERLDERLTALGLSDREASLKATGTASTIRNIKRGSEPSRDTIAKLATVLDTTPAYLAWGDTSDLTRSADALDPAGAADTIPIIGQVAAGLFLAVETEVDAPTYEDRIPADPDYPTEWQFAVEVRGTSVNRQAPDGARLGCVSTIKARIHPRDGDLVIVERREAEGQRIERTAKVFYEYPDRFELRPDSTDPRWQAPIVIPRGANDETVAFEVIGLVTYLHIPVKRAGRPRRV